MPTPGPTSPAKALQNGPRSLPMSSSPGDNVAKVHLTAEQIREQLLARERDMQYRIDALKHEALAVFDDVNIDGRPLNDYIRKRPLEIVGGTLATGALLGLMWGLRRRSKRRPEADPLLAVRARIDSAIDQAAYRVAQGADVEDALREAMPDVPTLYARDEPLGSKDPSATREALSVAMQTAVGFGVKAVMDMAIRRFTGYDGTIDAVTSE